MSDIVWVYGEVVDDAVTSTTLEMVTKAAAVGTAEAILLGPAPDDASSCWGVTAPARSTGRRIRSSATT